MKLRFGLLAVITAVAAVSYASGQDKPPPAPPTWEEMLARGIVPYHQLTVEDLPIDDKAHPKDAFYIKAVGRVPFPQVNPSPHVSATPMPSAPAASPSTSAARPGASPQ